MDRQYTDYCLTEQDTSTDIYEVWRIDHMETKQHHPEHKLCPGCLSVSIRADLARCFDCARTSVPEWAKRRLGELTQEHDALRGRVRELAEELDAKAVRLAGAQSVDSYRFGQAHAYEDTAKAVRSLLGEGGEA